MSTKEYLTIELSMDVDGVDEEATRTTFERELSKKSIELRDESDRIHTGIMDLFATEPKGTNILLPTIGSLVASSMQVPQSSYSAVRDRVMEYVRVNSQGKVSKEDGTHENPDSVFLILKGPTTGGVCLRSDYTPKPKKTTTKKQ